MFVLRPLPVRGTHRVTQVEVEIRAAHLDGAVGRQLLAAFVRDISDRYPGWHPGIGPSAEPGDFEEDRGRFLVALTGDTPLGCGGIKWMDAETGEVKRLYVLPAARGQGVSRLLLGALEDAARDLGMSRVRLDTGNNQPEALALFRSAGFREIGDYNANPAASYWFEKTVAPPTGFEPVLPP